MHQRHAQGINRGGRSAACRRSRPFGALVSCADADPGLRCASPWAKLSEPLRAPERARAPGGGHREVGSPYEPASLSGLPHTTGSAGGPDLLALRPLTLTYVLKVNA